VKNLSDGLAEVQLSKSMAQKWIDLYTKEALRELGCLFTPEGETEVVTGYVSVMPFAAASSWMAAVRFAFFFWASKSSASLVVGSPCGGV